jgi:hypothetical protein
MPTLLEKGKVVKEKWMSTKTKRNIDNMSGIDFLVEYIGDRMWDDISSPPIVKLRGPGSKVLVLRSGTGSGKSTLLPPFLYNKFFESTHKNIICTQPSIATATDIPYQILMYNPNLRLGENIGFQTGNLTRKPIKGILFATVGILLQHLKILTDEEFMRKYSHVIIDEAHARSMDVDSTLYYMKRLIERNWDQPECPMLIVMSATINPKIFMSYFKCPKDNFLDVVGSTFPIEDHFSKYNMTDYIMYVTDLVEKIHIDNIDDILNNDEFRDVLIFAQGSAQIRELNKRIHQLNANVFSKGLIEASIHSTAQWEKYKTGGKENGIYYLAPIVAMSANIQQGGKEYKDLFSKIDSVTVDIYSFDDKGDLADVIDTVPASRRIIIGTNAIETGLTIDTLKYCIDTGFLKQGSFNPNFGCTMLADQSVTQANSQQRRGRVGRKAPGIFYAVYTKETRSIMPPLPHPDIVKEDISQFLLGAIIAETKTTIEPQTHEEHTKESFQINRFDRAWYHMIKTKDFSASKLDFLQYPSSDSISYGMEKLHGLGFIDWEYNPTLFGVYATKFRKLSLENIRMIMAGYETGANILDLITIACCQQVGFKLGINKRKYIPRNPMGVSITESYYNYKMLFQDEFIEYLFIWDDFMAAVAHIGERAKYKHNTEISTEYLDNWAKTNKLNIGGLFSVVDNRDEIINDMISMGLNPFYNGMGLPNGTYNLKKILNRNMQEGIDEVQKIKKSIYEGYRFNLLIWKKSSKSYICEYSHIPVTVDSNLVKPFDIKNGHIEQTIPYRIISSAITLQSSFGKPGMFEFSASDISVLDGFVDVDETYLNN